MKEGNTRVELGDGLTQYMAAADTTVRDLCAADSSLLRALMQYDAYFRRDMWDHVSATPSFALILFLNAYQMFLGAARMALSGHPAAVFPLLRTALESASYGYLMEQQPSLSEVWGNRDRSEIDKKACRKAFTFDMAIKGLAHKAPDIERLAKDAYEGAIDYGAHPNLRVFSAMCRLTKIDWTEWWLLPTPAYTAQLTTRRSEVSVPASTSALPSLA